ncbi:porin family protein [Flavobacterium sp.]|uniref:porin family protein n=1 Tax=Flavobacterium sp. TaxID=239 RepID=UPI0026366F6E|nr:porin family protein [Flavobacterium sp.]
MQKLFQLLFLLSFLNGFSQEKPDFEAVDSLYREDQFYFGITYNILNHKPEGVSQNSFSAGVDLGFLRDFPINKKRTVAIAPGLGLSYKNYKQNLIIQEDNGVINYSTIATDAPFDKNKLAMCFVEMPIEFRWRTSTYDSHKFWRVYSGVKLSYMFYNKSRYIATDIDYKVSNNPDLNKFQYGAYVATGWNSWNFYAYYGFQNMFKEGTLNGKPLDMSTLNIGLMFYIL